MHWILAKMILKCDHNICLRVVVGKYFYSTAFEVNYSGYSVQIIYEVWILGLFTQINI